MDLSVVFEIASKYCISDSLVDYDAYFVYFKGFLPTVIVYHIYCVPTTVF